MAPIHMPTRLECYPGVRGQAGPTLEKAGLRSALLVVDPGLISTPWPDAIAASLREAGVRAVVFEELAANPRTSTAEAAAAHSRAEQCEAVVALGGGRALDTAKAAAMLATNPQPAASFAGTERFSEPALPMLALPTTCGTGSEVTWVAVLTDPERRAKISIKGVSMFPRWALVDPDLLATLPAHLVVWTGMDALTHAVEAATCRRATPFSRALATAAISALVEVLPRARQGLASDAQARHTLAWASTLAGMAFGNADVAAVHCLSESIGGRLDLPHGLLNACLLRPVLEALSPEVDPALAQLATGLGWSAEAGSGAAVFRERLRRLTKELELPGVRSLGITPDDVPVIADLAARNGSNASNVRTLATADYRQWLEAWLH